MLLRQRRQRGHGARHADPGAGPLDGHHPQRLPQSFAHHFPRGRDLHRRRRVGVQAALGQPHAADVGREAGLARRARPAPPRWIRRRGRRPRKVLRRGPIRRPHRGTTARPPRSPVITSATAPGTTAPSTSEVIAKNTSRLAASRVGRRRHHPHLRYLVTAQQLGVVGQRRLRARQRVGRELPCGVDALAQPHDPHLAVDVAQPAVDHVGDQAAGSSWCRSRSPPMPGSRPIHSALIQDARHRRLVGQHRQRLVAKRIHAGTLGQRVRDHAHADT